MKGMELCRLFYLECVQDILARRFPVLRYSAGLLGFGSDVLGYDDDASRDHMWGPRLLLFLRESDLSLSDSLMEAFCAELPRRFCGFPTGFGEPDEEGISSMDDGDGPFRPMISTCSFSAFLTETLGVSGLKNLTVADWLSFSEHKLLSLRSGKLFRDDLNLTEEISLAEYYPREVWLYLLASDWSCIAEEKAFVKRTASRGDDLGSRIICARIAHRIMHLCFLYEKQYPPYSKWFGTAFRELQCAAMVGPLLDAALRAADMLEREQAITRAQAAMICLHNASGITKPIPDELHPYFTRDILVADPDLVQAALCELLASTPLAHVPLAGHLSTPGNLVQLTEHTQHTARIRRLYE